MQPGSIVRCRKRDWVLLPSDQPDVVLLRPLAGASDQVVAIHRRLADLVGYTLPEERLQPATFPLPTVDQVADAAAIRLLWQAARLTLREGAAPLRSLGRISIRPRTYQFVPLLMALRLHPVRLLIADDVGVGKTIEALLIARELIDRQEIRQLCVLCPPYLCEQWQHELTTKFHLDAVIIRSGTITQLERQVPPGKSIYAHYPIQVVSIDFVKTDRNRHQFLLHCPELVIVDEAHSAAAADERFQSQQQRHRLLQELAADAQRHLLLLTATPHSGIDAAFRSLLGLLRPEFATWQIAELAENQRATLARYVVQRTRKDIELHWEEVRCFPSREAVDVTYDLSPEYRHLFERIYAFCSEIVHTGDHLHERQRRVRYWGALALLRCVMSSPAAARAALAARIDTLALADEESDFQPFIFEADDSRTNDEVPLQPVEASAQMLNDHERRRLHELIRLTKALAGPTADTKLQRCRDVVQQLLSEGFCPILWCRYIATADYLAEHLRQTLPETVQVVCVTGRMADNERRMLIESLTTDRPRVLVATDCLSEGINLQDRFNAVVHYDLPWNPNRLEQREGRVDRYGQLSSIVQVIRIYGRDNPVDGVVIDVLLNKAREIHRALGTYVPVPEDSASVTEAVLNALFLRRGRAGQQLELDLGVPAVEVLHRRWQQDAERERVNRTRFAQRALKPDEVRRELEATDAVLGDPTAVREFVLTAAQRLGLPIQPDRRRADVFLVDVSETTLNRLPASIRAGLTPYLSPPHRSSLWRISFVSPVPPEAEYLGRNHRFVTTLARFLFEDALANPQSAIAARCGVIRTRAVARLTTLWLLRVRYLLEQPDRHPLLAEEVVVVGQQATGEWLDLDQALALLAAQPDANVSLAEKRELIDAALAQWLTLHQPIAAFLNERADVLEQSHKRIRQAVALRVRELALKPQLPPDLLGILVLQPMVAPR